MFRFKILISLIIFSSFLFGTSIIKNQTREIEKDIYDLNKLIHQKEKDFKAKIILVNCLGKPQKKNFF